MIQQFIGILRRFFSTLFDEPPSPAVLLCAILFDVSCSYLESRCAGAQEKMDTLDALVLSQDFEGLGELSTRQGDKRRNLVLFVEAIYEYYGPCDASQLVFTSGDTSSATMEIHTRRTCANGEIQEKTSWVGGSADGASQLSNYWLAMYDPGLMHYLEEKKRLHGLSAQ